ncbi:MAG: gliding motility-associated protein GldE [Prevotella sp.]|nr:gliding motility-associated protein GldE [Prevotella sp.]
MMSASEIAFFSLSPKDISIIDEEHTIKDSRIKMLRLDSERTLATILITNNFVNVTIIMLCNYCFEKIIDFHDSVILQFVIVTILLTFLLLLFGEVMPKIYSAQKPLRFCRTSVGFILVVRKLFWPIESLLLYSRPLAEKIVQKDSHVLSVDDLEQALDLTDKNEIKDEQSLLKGIIRFGDENVKKIMISRQDIVDLNLKASFPEVLKCIIDNNYSRIPVYQGNIDNVKGILYIKDLLPFLDKPSNFHWQSLVRPSFFVPETKKIDELLREFQQNKVHIAIVVDEFGGTSGIVTLEDIIEEIVGEINDEYDEDEKNYIRLNKTTYIFEGKTPLSDFTKILNIDEETFSDIEGEADTLAGLILEIKGDFPSLHEKIDYKDYSFEVLEMDERRIAKIKVVVCTNNSLKEN